MKRFTPTALTLLLAACAPGVFAASSTDLSVTGVITPSACSPSFSSGGVIDHGKIAAKDLNPDRWNVLENRTLQLAISCDAPTLLALRSIDNQSSSSYDPANSYGLGMVSGKKLGDYVLVFSDPIADGAAISVLESRDNGITWRENYPSDIWPVSYLASFGDQSTGSWAPTPIKQVTADIRIETMIAPTAGMDLTNETPINGSATVEVRYL